MVALLALLAMPLAGCSREQPLAPSEATEMPSIDPVRNRIGASGKWRMLWNDKPVSGAQLAALTQAAAQLRPEPELEFQPDADSSYELSAKILEIIKASKTTKFGFVGNEQFSDYDQPAASPK